jgi:hypothetical protein
MSYFVEGADRFPWSFKVALKRISALQSHDFYPHNVHPIRYVGPNVSDMLLLVLGRDELIYLTGMK